MNWTRITAEHIRTLWHWTDLKKGKGICYDGFRPKFQAESKAFLYFQTRCPQYLYKANLRDVVVPEPEQVTEEIWICPYKKHRGKGKLNEYPIGIEIDVKECDESGVK